MSSSHALGSDAALLRAGGEKGALIVQFDWAATRLGPICVWPDCLKAATAILLDSPLPTALLWGRDGLLIYNDNYARLTGLTYGNALGAAARDVWRAPVGLADQILDAGLAGRPLSLRNQGFEVDRSGQQQYAWFDLNCSPVRDALGEPAGVLVIGVETSQQVLAAREAARKRELQRPGADHLHTQEAAESNAHLSAALTIARLGTFEWDFATQSFSFDARAREILGFGADGLVTWEELTSRIDAQDMLRIHAVSAAAEAAGQTRREFEYSAHLPDGSIRRVTVVTDLMLARDGRRRFTGVIDDVTERRAAERRQRMLINELNHRVKNTLATVQSIAAQTLRAAPSVENVREDFESRLVALAAAHDLLTAQGWHGAALADVAATAMRPFEVTHRPQIRRCGPPVELTAEHALALNLALHELATNAAKYGALSTAGGLVEVSWSVRHDELTLRWVEKDGPPVATPTRAGFGARLLQRSLARELGGAVDWTFAPQGVRCEIRCKVEQIAAASPVEIAEASGRRFNF